MYKSAILFIIILFLIGPIINQIPSDHNRYVEGVQANLTSNFDKPMLFYVGEPIYQVIGDYTFIVVPALCFFLSYMLIYQVFRKKNLNTLHLPVLLLLSVVWMGSLWLFMRDTLLFFFSACFLYFMEKDRLELAGVAAVLGAFTKVGGLLLLVGFIILIIRKYSGFPFISYIPGYINWIQTNIADFFRNLNRFPYMVLATFINPVMALTFFKPDLYTFFYILATLHIAALGYDLHHVYRYTVFLMPFGLVKAAELIRDRRKTAIVFGVIFCFINYLWFLFDSETFRALVGV